MFAKQLSMIVDALREIVPDNKLHVVDSLSSALGNYEQSLEHGGQVTITGELPRFTRTNSSLQPDPTTLGPIRFDGAMLNINNAPSGDSNKRGENGFAINVGGVSRFDELWGIKWATVDSSGSLGDEDKGYYYYSDGYECGNSSGLTSDVTETPVRVFYTAESAIPATGGKVAYMRDQRGLAYAISGGAGGGTDTVTVVTALQEDTEADELQYKDRAIYATPQAAESDWKTLLDLSGLGGPESYIKFGVLDADLNAGSSATVSVWNYGFTGDTGTNVTAYDKFLETGRKLEEGSRVKIELLSGNYYVTLSNTCPTAQ